ncbi:juvenile hormone acid O-methyltransferase-like isoform X2 [Planococcus citri]
MFQAQTYLSNHSLQVRDADEVLQKFKSEIKWKRGQKAIDIGCGPGDVTHDYLLPILPNDAELLAVDMCERMVNLGRNHYSDPRLNFDVLNLTNSEEVEKYESNFDLVFSFYCLNWIPDQRLALKNMYSMLKPGGEMLFTLVVDSPNHLVWELTAASPKWSAYMKNFRDTIPRYHYSDDPASEISELIRDVGFHIKHCSFEWKSFTFPTKQIFHKFMDGINPFLRNVPQCLLEEYGQEWEKTLWNEKLCFLHETGEVTYKYSVITAFAQKPVTNA